MDLLSLLLINLAAVVGLFVVLWAASVALKDVSIVDIFWGPSYVFIAWFTVVRVDPMSPRGLFVATLVTIWGLRLGGYLAWRNWGEDEDRRYRQMREKHGQAFPWVSLVTVFGLQATLAWIVSLPVQVGIAVQRDMAWWTALGGILWLVGLAFESIGDYQLARFKADPDNQGAVMDQGLWRYTRHPNYFGDFCVWWGIYLVAVDSETWWWTVLGPIVMSFLLMRVSGVPLLEKSMKERRPGYQQYVERTSPFFPWPPKNDAG